MSDSSLLEKDLLMQVAAGDEHAFAQLFDTYSPLLASHIYRLTNSTELSEEIIQDAFLKIWLNRSTLTAVNNFKAYLFIISKNHALNRLKQLVKEKLRKKELDKKGDEIYQTDEENPCYILLDEAIEKLPRQQKIVYMLSRHDRLTYAQIANKLGVSSETVKTYLKRARLSISDYLRQNSKAAFNILILFYFFLRL